MSNQKCRTSKTGVRFSGVDVFDLDVAASNLIDCIRLAPKTPDYGSTWPTSNTLLHALAYLASREEFVVNKTLIEFGVYSGKSLSKIAIAFPSVRAYGFDSFYGLPEAWVDKLPRGHFNAFGRQPVVARNVTLVSGFFQQTVPDFLSSTDGPAALVHLDADLYSSTVFVLRELLKARWIVLGTILVFDELVNYSKHWMEDGEFKALLEILDEFPSLKLRCHSRGGDLKLPPADQREYQHEQVMFEVVGV